MEQGKGFVVERHIVAAKINGDEIQFSCFSGQTLLDVLRSELYMTGTKNGCGSGDCGACTIVLNGRPVNACLVLGVELEGARIETIEGMAQDNQLHPLQQKFLDYAALQCGICTPGILTMAKAFLEKNPNPTEREVRFGLAGNLCRCTGYDKIVRAVLDAAAEMRLEKSE